MKEIKQILKAYSQANSKGQGAVLATVVYIEGSSYRAPGARMLITDEGELTGAISGGCLESDILRKALMVMQKAQPLLVTYDTSDEDNTLFAVNLGCNGIIHILLEPISEKDKHNPIALLGHVANKRQHAVLTTFFSIEDRASIQQGTKLLFSPSGFVASDLSLPLGKNELEADIRYAWERRSSAFIKFPKTSEDIPEINAFFEYLTPSVSLVVAGAGNDVLPLVAMANILGWELTIMDGRPLYANESRFPSCQLILTDPSMAIGQLQVDEYTAFVLMSHNFEYDKAVLKHALLSPAKYIGLLGPSKKRDKILEELQEEGIGIDGASLEKLHAPIGLDLGSESSEEIALSIVSEIQSVFADSDVEKLKNRKGKIHRRDLGLIHSIKSYGVLILASGESKRMGTPKQTIAYKGSTLLRNSAIQAIQLQTAVTMVIIPEGKEDIRKELEGLPVEIVENPGFREGMSSSIREGIKAIRLNHPHLEFILIMLCDQPYVDTSHLTKLVNTQRENSSKVTSSLYEGRKGVPALFHRSLFGQLLALDGDTGAKHLIEKLGNEVSAVSFPLGAFDVDTPEAKNQLDSIKG
ncbi:XdhC family protein [Belliella marina]|uniref:XdhC family protein n=1 Tax=Belliella marina TaxID=1644146 RepID=A0ABW4VS24_9BACT